MSRGEYKVPGGKLVAAEVEVTDGRLSSVHISGDFFLEPDDALERIDAALVDMPATATVKQMTQVLTTAAEGASLVGFTPDAVAIAVRRALGEATSWSDHTFEIVHPQPLLPIINLALDQVLLEEVAAGRRGPTLRLWEWNDDCVVIGSFQSLRNEVDTEQAAELGVQVVRRISGGGAMFMEPGNCITYSLYVPGSLVEGLSFEQSYAFLDDWVLGALERVGIEARYVPLNDISSPQGKIGGAAQKRLAGGAVLHHVTMSYDIDAEKMTRVLRIGREKLSDKGTTSAVKRVDPMRSQSGMAREDIISEMKDYFRSRYATTDGDLRPEELERAEELARTKFSDPDWVARVP